MAKTAAKNKKPSFFKKAVGTVLLVFLITACIVGTAFVMYILQFVDVDSGVNPRALKLDYTSIVYATDPETGESYELQRLFSGENRVWVGLEEIPDHVQKAAIAAEDKRFESHHGVDWRRTIFSAVNELLRFRDNRQGGSTITQQLIKNITKEDEVRIERKIKEIFSALNLEKKYSKDEILEAYLNTIHLGNNTNGVQAAANLYFDKDVKDLTLAEAASIIAITQYPVYYNPFSYPENNKVRQEYILNEMLKAKFISQEEYEQAVAEELVFQEEKYYETITATNSWFVDTVIEELIVDFTREFGWSRSYAVQQILSGGYQIYTTYDKNVQPKLEEIYKNDRDNLPKVRNKEQPESAFVVLGYDGSIKGIVGGRGEKTGSRSYNRATMSKRSPGSTIKPIGLYTLSIQQGLINWSTIISDEPFLDNTPDDGIDKPNWPVNYYTGYRGDMTVDRAIQLSCNTVAVKVCSEITFESVFDFMKSRLGMTSLVDRKVINGRVFTDNALAPMSLGSLTDGVSVLEMAAAYQIFGNGGIYCPPHSYTEVYTVDGDLFYTKEVTPVRAITEETASVMNLLLQNVVSLGTGTPAYFSSEIATAGKTGTTSDNKDLWYVGLTPYYVGAVWMGFDEQKTISYNSPYPPPAIWKTVMKAVHEDLPAKSFPIARGVVAMEYCEDTGLLAGSRCKNVSTGYYLQSNIPEQCRHGSGRPSSWGSGNWNSSIFEDIFPTD